MTLNIFDSSFAFQRSLVDTDSLKGSQKEYAPANDRDAFKVSGRSDERAAERSKKSDDDFSAFLKSAQDDQDKQTNKSDQAEDVDNIESQKYAFATKESSDIQIFVPTSTEGADDLDSDALLASLSEDIRAFIEELVQSSEREGQNIVTEVIVDADKPAPDVSALLGMFVSLADKNSGSPPVQSSETITLTDLVQAVQNLTQENSLKVLTSNLSPQEITQLQQDVRLYTAEQTEQDNQDALAAFAAQIVSLIEPGSDQSRQNAKVNDAAQAHETSRVQEATVNNVPKENTVPPPAQQGLQTSRFDGRYDIEAQTQNVPRAQGSEQGSPEAKVQNTNAAGMPNNTPPPQGAGERFLQLLQTSQGAVPLTETGVVHSGATGVTNAGSAIQNSLTNISTQSPSATQAHPATQMVSATIQKAVRAGEDTTIKLRLDPPELGRVEVKMSIDKDNTTRIVLTAEKPETFLMLQRDADTLQRAMADAGLDTNGDLSFELASDDHDFDGRQSSDDGQRDGAAAGADDIIEETTLDLQVDPATGAVRYNILV